MKRERSEGCLFGTAIGDALAAPTEFIRDLNAMEKRFGSREKFELIGDPALVTDDTQMALAVAEALIASELLIRRNGWKGRFERRSSSGWIVRRIIALPV